jgi:hypothetical protein
MSEVSCIEKQHAVEKLRRHEVQLFTIAGTSATSLLRTMVSMSRMRFRAWINLMTPGPTAQNNYKPGVDAI